MIYNITDVTIVLERLITRVNPMLEKLSWQNY